MGWSEAMLPYLAREYLRYIVPSKGLNRKCIMLDLDNTLWGGIVGEDGLGGIHIGPDAPGNAFALFQQALLTLWKRGILLAVCSKNVEAEALAVFDEHPDMVLRREHLAAHRINWQDKVENVRELAQELNIGLESLVFLDDNPVERARMRAALPEVLTPELPTDPSHYRSMLLDLPVFETLALTNEDRNRNRMYAEQQARRAHAARYAGADALGQYLADLGIVVGIAPASSLTLPRLAQLTRKTNQFNATTRRYGEADLAEMVARGHRVYAVRAGDRFGDYGVVGAAIVAPASSACWELDTLLLSCRAMGRGVESAMLAAVAGEARRHGAAWLEGWIVPTERNEPVRSCYRDHGFALAREDEDGRQLWRLDVACCDVPVPAWLSVREEGLACAAVE
jgi:FkbH-like protein